MLKKLIAIFFILPCFLFSNDRIESIKNKISIDSIVYFKGEKLPFSGKFVDTHLKEEYRDGVREGYYKNIIEIDGENYLCEGRFENGLKHGEWLIKFSQGKPKAILKYYYDRPIGEWKYFYSNGNIMEIERFVDGALEGEIVIFNSKGIPKVRMNFEEGLLNEDFIAYHPNGKISTLTNFKLGKLNGELKLFTTQGVKIVDGYYKLNEREGEWRFFYNTGELKSIVNYKNGKRDGKSIIYGKGGEILQDLNFKEGLDSDGSQEYKNYGDKILKGFERFTEDLEYKKYDKILDEI